MKKHLIFTVFVLSLVQSFAFGQRYKAKPITGLLGAFGAEVALVKESLQKPKTVVVDGITFTCGRIGKQRIVVAETGIGKVNAAMTTSLMLDHFRPSRILFTGIAGGTNPDLQPGDIVIAGRTAHHDYSSITDKNTPTRQTRNAITKEFNPVYFPADSSLMHLAEKVVKTVSLEGIPLASGGVSDRPVKVVTGTVVTGDVFVASVDKVKSLRTDFGADATEMEGAAVAQVCYQIQVPHLIMRSLSDRADAEAHIAYDKFYPTAARNSAKLVIALVKAL
ncbi:MULTISPECIES: 5'-methylthioadenosine/adenosylhomocysteine nucleosidase [unclassified Spirosoma]|uniref:5'-methylthioadenosine/adenosylhomocysteine nucleosidase n=1 Tax=unclassified Spirosoma TaxID=2621999 RepID=UPI0009602243|nr:MULTISPECIES: 5'-methylthioadenosine/adenosylhomocysteine nucleosidase [unclassified Spirosoma]MBN8826448.1 5'-methylthioadenosine/adenosylhomocysteine nucleosidase [Spirosoma sp.]OJW75837.1 MAG: adenosylhomocysteine nucleosidase [Spirosoma sp. 48-14]